MNNYDGLLLVVLGFNRWFRTKPDRLILLFTAPFRALRPVLSRRYPKVLVIEYGTDRVGYLQPLVDLALIRGVTQTGLVILGEEHDYIDQLERHAAAPVLRIGGRGQVLAARIARLVAQRLLVPDDVIDAALLGARVPELRLERFHLGPIKGNR